MADDLRIPENSGLSTKLAEFLADLQRSRFFGTVELEFEAGRPAPPEQISNLLRLAGGCRG